MTNVRVKKVQSNGTEFAEYMVQKQTQLRKTEKEISYQYNFWDFHS